MLGRIALRIVTVEALKGATLVEDNVLDSEIGALDVAADGSVRTAQDKPFTTVYTDATRHEGTLQPRDLHSCGKTDLTIETGVTGGMTVKDDETGEETIMPGMLATDRALEFFLDCVGRQIVTALTDPNNPWAEIWRGLSRGIAKVERKRTSDGASGTRIAAHQLVVTVDLLPDPPFGEPMAPTSIWAKLLLQMEATAHPYLPQMRALIGTPGGILASEAQRRRFGMTIDEARALFDIAVQPAEATEPLIQSITVERMSEN